MDANASSSSFELADLQRRFENLIRSGHNAGDFAELHTDWATVARKQGLRGKQVDKFLEVIGNIAADEDQETIKNFGPTTSSETMAKDMHGAYMRAIEKAVYIAQQASVDYENTGSSGDTETANTAADRGFGGIRPSRSTATSATSATETASASNTTANTSHTVTVNIGGRSTTINAASAEDASSLAALLKSLEQAASSSM